MGRTVIQERAGCGPSLSALSFSRAQPDLTEIGPARSDDPACYSGGRVQYGRLAQTAMFKSGIERVERGAVEHRIALMCAEKEPLDCHRTLLV